MTMFMVSIEDALDHSHNEEFDTLEEAQAQYDEWLKAGPEGYELSVCLEEIIGDYEDYREIAYHQWFTDEEWEAAHPSGFPD